MFKAMKGRHRGRPPTPYSIGFDRGFGFGIVIGMIVVFVFGVFPLLITILK